MAFSVPNKCLIRLMSHSKLREGTQSSSPEISHYSISDFPAKRSIVLENPLRAGGVVLANYRAISEKSNRKQLKLLYVNVLELSTRLFG